MLFWKKTYNLRLFAFIIADIVLISLSVWIAFYLRFDGKIPAFYFGTNGVLWQMILILLIYSLLIFYSSGLYFFSWSYVSTVELASLFRAVTVSFFLFGLSLVLLNKWEIIGSLPRSTVIISYFLVFLSTGGIRISKRIFFQTFSGIGKGNIRVLIAGAGDIGEQTARNILLSKEKHYKPVGFLDNSPDKKGVRIHGLPVLGGVEDIPYLVQDFEVSGLIIAYNSSEIEKIKNAVDYGRRAGLKNIKIISEKVALRDIETEDLLWRNPITIDKTQIKEFITGKSVLITGAAGSIGSELSRQVTKFNPGLLLLLDQDETGIFNISGELAKKFGQLKTKSFVCDITDNEKINKVFSDFHPSIVFHAAAYKHVPLMEREPEEAVKNNIFGLKCVAEAAVNHKCEKFVFISTDKAVNPTSVMGATKRVGEMICQSLNKKGITKFVSVRFGNVLDSRGSVIPIFKEQIRKKGPVEVTHPEMKRYFMLIPEACQLVMQAGEMGVGGEVFVLNMGEPIMIWDLAKEMIRLSGYKPDIDIPIVFTGMRPGEKLFEEMLTSEEGTVATQNKDIYIAKLSETDEEMLNLALQNLAQNQLKKEEIISQLKTIIPNYTPDYSSSL